MRWRIEHGDAMRLLAELPADSVDLVLTDPPYSSGGAFRSDRAGKTTAKYSSTGSVAEKLPEFHGDSRTERGLLLWSALWLGEAWRVTKPGGAIAVWCDWRSLPTVSDAIQAGGWSWRGIGIWQKPQHRSRPTMGGLWNDTEYILWGSKGPRNSGECLPGHWLAAAPSAAARLHATEKPQIVLEDLVRLAQKGGIVLDPFAGSASAGVAALTSGRDYIGFELSAEYVAIGRERLGAVIETRADVRTDAGSLFEVALQPDVSIECPTCGAEVDEDDIRSSPVDRDGAPHHEDTYPECEDLAP